MTRWPWAGRRRVDRAASQGGGRPGRAFGVLAGLAGGAARQPPASSIAARRTGVGYFVGVWQAVTRPIVVAGPTGTGKSELGLDLARAVRRRDRQCRFHELYRGMDIGSAKLVPAERRGIPHHLLDVLDVSEIATVASYQRDARACIEDILARGADPVLVGGSGLYIQSLLDDIDFPATDPAVRSRLQGDLDRLGIDYMFGLLAGRIRLPRWPSDRPMAARSSGRWRSSRSPAGRSPPRRGAAGRGTGRPLRLDRPTDQLDQRLEPGAGNGGRRFPGRGAAAGLAGLRRGVTASRALGYAQLLAVLDGEIDLEQAIMATARPPGALSVGNGRGSGRDTGSTWLDGTAPGIATAVASAWRSRSLFGVSSSRGTDQNDFVLLPDPDDTLVVTPG